MNEDEYYLRSAAFFLFLNSMESINVSELLIGCNVTGIRLYVTTYFYLILFVFGTI